MFIKQPPEAERELVTRRLHSDLVVVGGGMAGVCGALTAAWAGIKVVLIQDRPVLGGNASSEVRLWILGATAHMGNNNRWAREGGVIDGILVENLYRNPEGNPLILDTILLEKVTEEPNLTLLLNTSVFEVSKSKPDHIDSVSAFNSQNSTMYDVRAPLFVDASGDGMVGFLSGAAFRMGAEPPEEFGEGLAPDEDYGHLLGHSIYFYTKDAGVPVKFVPPSFALKDITKIPRFHRFNAQTQGCQLWWLEYGGRLNTVHDTEAIKWELWKVVYGVWDYIKNSGHFPEAQTLTLEWVGHIPGKRESRRFEGDYILTQRDIIEQHQHQDAVAHGGWSIDLHPADGVYSERPPCSQWHARGVYQIPYRCLYSRNIKNLFLAGRIISTSHVAFASTRVMGTCAAVGQAAGMAAALCKREGLFPRQIGEPAHIGQLQMELLSTGQHIPGFRLEDPEDVAQKAKVTASSELHLAELKPDGPVIPLNHSWAQMLPVPAGSLPRLSFTVDVSADTELELQLCTSSRPENYTPDVILAEKRLKLRVGREQRVAADFNVEIDTPRYVFVCLVRNEQVSVHCTTQRLTGILSVCMTGKQEGDVKLGIETIEFWCPRRRPEGHNLAVTIDPPLVCFSPGNVINGFSRPTSSVNAWVADPSDPEPTLTLEWKTPQTIARIELAFDTDFDHPLESVQWGHPERALPFCVKGYRILDGNGRVLAQCDNNHQTRNSVVLEAPVTTDRLVIKLDETQGNVPAALFALRCYG